MPYLYKRTITIDHTKCGSSDSTDFPVLVSITNNSFKTTGNGGRITNSSGFDLIFTSDSAGTSQIAHEIEFYDGTAGTIVMWVKVATVSSSVDTVFYMFYGNSSISSSQENITGTWNSNFKGVWHLKEASGTLADSTSNGRTGTAQNSPTYQITGQVQYGMQFTLLGNKHLTTGVAISNFISDTDCTFSSWVSPTGVGTINAAVYVTEGVLADSAGYIGLYRQNLIGVEKIAAYNYHGGITVVNGTVTVDVWTHAVMTHTGGVLTLYLNGASQGTTSSTTTDQIAGNAIIARGYTSGQAFNGSLDECRILSAAVGADWVTTEYNNQNSPSTFIALGSETANGNAVTVAVTSPTVVTVTKKVNFIKTVTVISATVVVVTKLVNYLKTVAVTSPTIVLVSTGAKQAYNQTVAAISVTVVTVSKLSNRLITVAVTSPTVVTITKLTNFLKTVAVLSPTVVTITKVLRLSQTVAVVSVSVVTVTMRLALSKVIAVICPTIISISANASNTPSSGVRKNRSRITTLRVG